jgi:hypothetical protein
MYKTRTWNPTHINTKCIYKQNIYQYLKSNKCMLASMVIIICSMTLGHKAKALSKYILICINAYFFLWWQEKCRKRCVEKRAFLSSEKMDDKLWKWYSDSTMFNVQSLYVFSFLIILFKLLRTSLHICYTGILLVFRDLWF